MTSKSTIRKKVQYKRLNKGCQRWIPHSYQKRAIRFAIERMCAALFLDPGLGKTSITLGAFKILKDQGMVDRLYVIAPLRVAHCVWPNEAEKWEDFKHLKVAILHGPDKEKLLESEADIFVINPEGLEWLLGVEKIKSEYTGKVSIRVNPARVKQLNAQRSMLVVDESTKFKNPASHRFRVLKELIPKFRRRYILTGTPAPNGLMDLFGQMYIVDEGRSLGKFITHYRRDFFDSTGFGGFVYTPKPDALERILEKIAPYTLRMRAEDYLELPQKIVTPIYVELPPEARKVYKEMERLMIAELQSGEVLTAVHAGAAAGKCRQVANGGIYRDDNMRQLAKIKSEEWIDLHEAKVDAVEELFSELNGAPLLVAYEFKHDLYRLQKRFPHAEVIGGGVSAKRSKEIERAWNDGNIEMLLAHPAAVGHGLNLQEKCQHVCWHSNTYDFELEDQFNKRVLRQGNKAPRVFIYKVIALNTVDEVIIPNLGEKDFTQSSFLDALKAYAETLEEWAM